MKILFVSNTANFSKFNRPFMKDLRLEGWIVDYVSPCEEEILDCDNSYYIYIGRNPFSLKIIKSIRQLKKILIDNNYDIVHCHTPLGGFITRIAAKQLWKQHKIKVLYTAHGFHFYRGAPLLNWLLYYPIEKLLSQYTDLLITINNEDYNIARRKFSCNTVMINGVGVDISKFVPLKYDERRKIREKNGYTIDDFLITIVAETNRNKNQIMLIKRVCRLCQKIPKIKILLVGSETLKTVRQYVEKKSLDQYVHFLGYRRDIPEITGMSDIAFSASKREGLPINIIEALACGVPVVASKNRGHISLIRNEQNGLLFNLNKPKSMCDHINNLYSNKKLRNEISKNAVLSVVNYDLQIIRNTMRSFYYSSIDDTI